MNKNKVILVIDDEREILELINHNLKEAGYYAVLLDKAQDFERQLTELLPCAIITDIYLDKGQNGLQLAEAARGVFPDLPIFVISGYLPRDLTPEIESHLKKLRITDFTSKPFSFSEYVQKITKMIERT